MTTRRIIVRRISLILLVCIAGVAGIVWSKMRGMPNVPAGALSVQPVQIGILKPGASYTAVIKVANRTGMPVSLLPAESSCGCVSLDAAPISIAPFEEYGLAFRFTAPDQLGVVNREIVLRARNNRDVYWTIPVTATVAASVWAEPSVLRIEHDGDNTLSGTVIVRHPLGVEVQDVKSSTKQVSVREKRADEMAVLEVYIERSNMNSETGNSLLSVNLSNGEQLKIPVEWGPQEKLRCVPTALRLNEYTSRNDDLIRTLIVFARTDEEMEKLQIVPAVSWVRVVSVVRAGASSTVKLEFDQAAMPSSFNVVVIQFSVDAGKSWTSFSARGFR
jgi:hypothetical protein